MPVVSRDIFNAENTVGMAFYQAIRFVRLGFCISLFQLVWRAENTITLQVLSDKVFEVISTNSGKRIPVETDRSRDTTRQSSGSPLSMTPMNVTVSKVSVNDY